MKLRLLIIALLVSWSTSVSAGYISAAAHVTDNFGYSPWLDVGDVVDFDIEFAETLIGDDFEEYEVTSLVSYDYDPTNVISWDLDWGGLFVRFFDGVFITLDGYAYTESLELDGCCGSFAIYGEDADYNYVDVDLSWYEGGIKPAQNDVPEPGTLGLLGLGLVMLGLRRRIARA